MAYTQYTLDSLSDQLGVLLDDEQERYWSKQEKYYAIWEALRVWGAYTSYWRTRGTFNLNTTDTYYDLSAQLPTLRSRTWTLDDMVKDIQYMCLEAPNGVTGVPVVHANSGQISLSSIKKAIQRARNQFVQDAKLPLFVTASLPSAPPPDGMVEFQNNSVFLHRVAWQNNFTKRWINLWRQDAWAIDHQMDTWTVEPGVPACYSESENAPLKLQIAPLPDTVGKLEVLSVDSFLIDTEDPTATFNIPDEWIHAVKYCALADLFSSESQNTDPVRSGYANMRYKQALDLCKTLRSVIRVTVENVPLPIDSLTAMDANLPYWRNQSGRPQGCGVLYDLIAPGPLADRAYGVAVDVVQSAPIPTTGNAAVQLGPEDIDHIMDYCSHTLIFKCGGKEFTQTFTQYDDWMEAVKFRGKINAAKIHYAKALLGQSAKEQADRPDVKEG